MSRPVHVLTVLLWLAAGCVPGPGPTPPAEAPPMPLATVIDERLDPLVGYSAPVVAPVSDRFRPPATDYGPGNRGLEYSPSPGELVRAAAAGRVAFAGPVGGTVAVSIDHADGVRTSYTHLAQVGVVAGDVVARGEPIGRTTDRLHFGARLGSVYLDPAGLLESPGEPARLVPDRDPDLRGQPTG